MWRAPSKIPKCELFGDFGWLTMLIVDLTEIQTLVVVVDPKKDEVVNPCSVFTLVVSSPDKMKLGDFLKDHGSARRIMPQIKIGGVV